jgi:putative glutamine amidotransferase
MARPVVGVCTYVETASWGSWTRRAALLPWTYVEAIESVGAMPVLLPPAPVELSAALPRLDALVLSGGPDIHPSAYGAAPEAHTVKLQPERDRAETALLRAALAAGMPLLGICRGMQLLNVGLGGDLVQHLPDKVGHDGHRPSLGEFASHEVRLDPDSRVGRALGSPRTVPSHHHQGVGVLGEGLTAVGWAEDGTVEAIEVSGERFAVGVLWHPEESDDHRLFAELVAATRA